MELREFRYAIRALRRYRGAVIAATLSLGLGVGANAALFTLIDAIQLQALPIPAPQELVELRIDDMTHARGTWIRPAAVTNPLWEEIRRQQTALSSVFAWADEPLEMATVGASHRINALWVSGDFFPTLGIRPALGRLFSQRDDDGGCLSSSDVVISDGFWRSQFGANESIVGTFMQIGSHRLRIAGVTPPSFFGLEVGRSFDVALPVCAEPTWHPPGRLRNGTMWWLTIMGRMKPGSTMESVSASLRASSPAIFGATLPPGYPVTSVKPYLAMTLVALPARGGLSRLRDQYARPLQVLFAITGLVLVIACINLAHLAMARGHDSRRELLTRVALGASRSQLMWHIFVEAVVLALPGLALGLLLAPVLTASLVKWLAAVDSTLTIGVGLSLHSAAFEAGIVFIVSVACALIPASHLSSPRQPPSFVMAERAPRSTSRRLLLASQLALSTALLTATLLLGQTLRSLVAVDSGFHYQGSLIATVSMAEAPSSPSQPIAWRQSLIDRVRALPEVQAAAEMGIVPLGGRPWSNRVWTDGHEADAAVVMRNMVGPDYFKAAGIPVLRGREFDLTDLRESRHTAVVNHAFVERFGGSDAILGTGVWVETTPSAPGARYEIVGVVGDTKYADLREVSPPQLFVPPPAAVQMGRVAQILIRPRSTASELTPAVKRVLDGAAPRVRYSFQNFERVMESSVMPERLLAVVSGALAALALVLATSGLYGVTTYVVERRSREIAIRVALGARRDRIIRLVMRDVGISFVWGVAAAVVVAFAGIKIIARLLFGTSATQSIAFLSAAALLAIVCAVASYLPARRAANIDPSPVLRSE